MAYETTDGTGLRSRLAAATNPVAATGDRIDRHRKDIPVIVYNLFPLLVGDFSQWRPHLERASRLGFDWVFINPIQAPGFSGSLYSIRDHFAINPLLLHPASSVEPLEQARLMVREAHRAGLKVLVDLVVNHTAIDCEQTSKHPEWYVRQDGRVQHPSCFENGEKVVWGDLAQLDHEGTDDPEGLFAFVLETARFLLRLGVDGFRCDAAYQIPRATWARLFAALRAERSDLLFVAETLGCTPEETLETARAGFDFIFNSSKWWDFESDWLLQQYDLTRQVAPSIGFPESHDTERLLEASGGNAAASRQRYLFTALFSSGVMAPIGFEFGFRRRLHVVHTRPAHWEATQVDLGPFIAAVHRVKRAHAVFHEEGPVRILQKGSVDLLVLHKAPLSGPGAAVIVLNKDVRRPQFFEVPSLSELFGPNVRWVKAALPEGGLYSADAPFRCELGEGNAVVLVAGDELA